MALFGEVVYVVRLTPRMVRVVLGGEGLNDYTPTTWTDQYVNAIFVPSVRPTRCRSTSTRCGNSPRSIDPVGRRYTIRKWDEAAHRLTIDFVVHGDTGVAGRWAGAAARGDRLQIVGPTGGYAPDPGADAHLLVGDERALPAIPAALERIPEQRHALAVVLVDDADHELGLDCPGELTVTWVHRATASQDPGLLLRGGRGDRAPTRASSGLRARRSR